MPTRDHDDVPGNMARHFALRYGRDVPAPRPDAAIDLHRTEYAELKDEQRTRMTTRDNLGYATWAGIGLVIAAGRVTSQDASPVLWLALPFVVVVLGWTRLQNDIKISRIGEYIQQDLAPWVSRLAGEPVWGWESAHNGPGTRRQLLHAVPTGRRPRPVRGRAGGRAAGLLDHGPTGLGMAGRVRGRGVRRRRTRRHDRPLLGVRLRGRDTSGAVTATDPQTVTPSMASQNEGA